MATQTAQNPKKILTQMTPTKILGTIPYVASTQQVLKIDRSFMYRSLNLRFTGSITTGGTTTTANLSGGDEWAVVLAIELIANGGNVLRYITGEQLVIFNYLLAGMLKDLVTLSGGAATYAWDTTVPLWLCAPGMGKTPIDFTLNATLLDDLFLRITWGTPQNVNNETSTTMSATSAIEVSADMAYFLDATINPAFNLTQVMTRKFSTVAPTGSGQQGFDWQVPVSQVYCAMLFNTKNAGTGTDSQAGTVASPSGMGSIVIQSGINQFFYFDSKVEKRMNGNRAPLPALSFTAFLNNTKNIFDAWTLIKFPRYWLTSESFNTRGFQNCDAYLQNAGTNNLDINVITFTMIPTATVTG